MSHQTPGPQHRRSQRDRMLAGELYIADVLQLAADSLRALKLTQQFNTSDPSNPQARRAALRKLRVAERSPSGSRDSAGGGFPRIG